MQFKKDVFTALIMLFFIGGFAPGCGHFPEYVSMDYFKEESRPILKSEKKKRVVTDSERLPLYTTGTKFVYSDGSWEKILEADADKLVWLNHRGEVSTGSPDFTYRRGAWESSRSIGGREFKQASSLFEEATTSLWPLAVGKQTRFEEYVTHIKKKNSIEKKYSNYWRCKVEGEERLTISSGTYDTWKIVCSRYLTRKHYFQSKPRENKTWYYSPEVNHWIMQKRDFDGRKPVKTKELIAILPDIERLTKKNDQSIGELKKQFQAAMEKGRSGVKATWKSPDGALVVSTTPEKIYRHETERFCRLYSQNIVTGKIQTEYFGLACRDLDEVWRIPRK